MFFQYPEYYTLEMVETEEVTRKEEYIIENEADAYLSDKVDEK